MSTMLTFLRKLRSKASLSLVRKSRVRFIESCLNKQEDRGNSVSKIFSERFDGGTNGELSATSVHKGIDTDERKRTRRSEAARKYIDFQWNDKSNSIHGGNDSEPTKHFLENKQLSYRFPFKNLVLSGGGAKGLAYCGVLRAFEKFGLIPRIKRYAGTGVGSIAALLFSIGCNSYDLEQLFSVNNHRLFKEGWFIRQTAYMSGEFSQNHDKNIVKYLENILVAKGYSKDIDFLELCFKHRIELCIVVINASTMTKMYCHFTTTAHLPIIQAVRMSMHAAGNFEAVKYRMHGEVDYYTDGGLICNYPIYCFDGWSLNKNTLDSLVAYRNFLKDVTDTNKPKIPIKPLCEGGILTLAAANSNFQKKYSKQDEKHNRTLGCLLYSELDQLQNKSGIEKNSMNTTGKLPDTPLARLFLKRLRMKNLKIMSEEAAARFLMDYMKITTDGHVYVDSVITKEKPMPDNMDKLLGKQCTRHTFYNALDIDGDGKVTFLDLLKFYREVGFKNEETYKNLLKSDNISQCDFIRSIVTGLSSTVNANYLKETDVDRTIGVNTHHITSQDISLEEDDKKFLIEQGQRCTEQYLHEFMVKNPCWANVDDEKATKENSDAKNRYIAPDKPSIDNERLAKLRQPYLK